MICKNCGQEIDDRAAICVHCGVPTQNGGEADTQSTGLNILSFFVPLAGIIMYFCMKEKTPIKAKGIIKWALISIVISVVMSACSILLSMAMVM